MNKLGKYIKINNERNNERNNKADDKAKEDQIAASFLPPFGVVSKSLYDYSINSNFNTLN